MFSLDDRSGNVLTTVALFVVAAAIVYVARGAFFISKQRPQNPRPRNVADPSRVWGNCL